MSEPATKTLWPWFILGAILLFVVGMASLIVMSVSSPFELVAKDYYDQELAYQTQIDREQRTLALPEKPAVTFDGASKTLELRFPHDVDGGVVRFYRPSAKAMDFERPLELDANRLARIEAGGMASGYWSVRLNWARDGLEYFQKESVMIP